nr:GNAT family N-acetyltransferase [Salinirubrum litoreum]
MQIRRGTAADADAVYEVHRRAFDGRTEESRLVQRLHDADAALVSLVAVDGDRIVGHVLFSPVSVEDHGETVSYPRLQSWACQWTPLLPSNRRRRCNRRLGSASLT